MPGGIRRASNRRLVLHTPSTNLGPLASGSTVSVPKYPGGIDTPATYADGKTILSSIWLNFLGRIIEAIEAEVGPIGSGGFGSTNESNWIRGHANLRDLLDDITLAKNSFKAGAIVGLHRFTVKKSASLFATVASLSLDVGKKPSNAQPLFFGTMYQGLLSNSTFLPGAAIVRGSCTWTSGTSLALSYRAMALGSAKPGAGGAPVGSYTAEMDGLIVFVPLGSPAA